jgi:hypothetical protein
MKWGVRKAETGGSGAAKPAKADKGPFWTPERKHRAKQVAIGTGILVAVAGAAFVGYKLHQNGKLPLSALKKKPPTPQTTAVVKKIVQEPTDIIHATRGKNRGFGFLKKGGIPDPLASYERAFGANSGKLDVFEKLDDGSIASSFLDPSGRKDFSGRVIPHQVLIPKSMTEGINSQSDVMSKIWPKLKPAYDAHYDLPAYDSSKTEAAKSFIDKSGVSKSEADAAKKYAEEFLKKAKG